jgi:hypothetical protein
MKYYNDINSYNSFGFAIVKLYEEKAVKQIQAFAKNWIYGLLSQWVKGKEGKYPLRDYNRWSERLGVDHDNILIAKNRHIIPEDSIKKILINDRLKEFLAGIGVYQCELWDEGLGWLAFRFIRPGKNDGYPWSKKSWGPAKNVISIWIPIIGHSSDRTLRMIPGSHKKKHCKYLPKQSKFRKDEYRLLGSVKESNIFSPDLKAGEMIFYHPELLHSENVTRSESTRLNFEFRIHRTC